MSLIVGLVSQSMVMSRSFTLFDGMFDLAHTLKIVSYFFVFVGLVINMYQLFSQAERSAVHLVELNQTLQVEVEERQKGEDRVRAANHELKAQAEKLAEQRLAALNMMEEANEARNKALAAEDALRKSQQRLAERAEALTASNADLEQFAYVASHDLQEPLRKVASFCQMLQNKYGPQLDEDANTYISYAVDGATRMKSMVADLLEFSRVGRKGKEPAPTDVAKSLKRALDNLQLVIEENDAVITCDELPIVMADQLELVQLLQNLVGNAIKYRSDSRHPEIHVSVVSQLDRWVFSVSDNGIGIGEDYYKKIFEIFKRLHARGEYSSTGIGLAICKNIVDGLGGKIWLESQVGEGSTFYFLLAKIDDGDENDPQSTKDVEANDERVLAEAT